MKVIFAGVLILFLFPSIASAGMGQLGLLPHSADRYFLEGIIFKLMLEYLFVRRMFCLPPNRSIIAVCITNGCSVLIGVLLTPVVMIIWGLFYLLVIYQILCLEVFAPIKLWVIKIHDPFSLFTLLTVATLIIVFVEGYLYKKFFKIDFSFQSKKFWWLLLANVLSLGIAITCVLMGP